MNSDCDDDGSTCSGGGRSDDGGILPMPGRRPRYYKPCPALRSEKNSCDTLME